MVLALRTKPALAVAKVARSCDKAGNDYTRKHLLTGDSGFVMITQHPEDTSPQHTENTAPESQPQTTCRPRELFKGLAS